MNIGNELYSNLSCLARQSFLLFTELPSQLTVFDTDYIFEYSESYSGNVIGDCSIGGYQYCVPFHRYQAIDISKKKELKEKRMEKKPQIHDIDMCIEKFKKQINSGPFHIYYIKS